MSDPWLTPQHLMHTWRDRALAAEAEVSALRERVEDVAVDLEHRAAQAGGNYEAAVRRSVCRSVAADLRAALAREEASRG